MIAVSIVFSWMIATSPQRCYLCLGLSHLNERFVCGSLAWMIVTNVYSSLTWKIAVTMALSPEWSLWLRLFHLNDSYLCLRLFHLNDHFVLNDSYLCLRFSHLNDRYQRLLFFHFNNGSFTWMIAVTTALLLEWSLWLRLFYLNDSHLCLRLSYQWSLCLRFSHEWPLWLRLSYLNDRCDYGALTWMIAVTVALYLNDRCLCWLFCLQVMIIDFW
jgi:hypothetical protein